MGSMALWLECVMWSMVRFAKLSTLVTSRFGDKRVVSFAPEVCSK